MARRKNLLLDEVSVGEFNTKYSVFLTPQDTFNAIHDGKLIAYASDASHCKSLAYEHLRKKYAVEWKPAIKIIKKSRDGMFGIFATRIYIAVHPYGHYCCEDWNTQPEYRETQYSLVRTRDHKEVRAQPLPFQLEPMREGLLIDGVTGCVVEYSEEIWEDCVKVMDLFGHLRKRIDALVTDPSLAEFRTVANPGSELALMPKVNEAIVNSGSELPIDHEVISRMYGEGTASAMMTQQFIAYDPKGELDNA